VIGQKQKIYLCSILDLYDKSIVAYSTSYRNDNKLVFDTFDKAISLNPTAKPIFHSDRGFQFTSKVFKFKLDEQGIIQSMSRVGKCIDNRLMEAFWVTIKSEMYYLNKFYTTVDEDVRHVVELIFNMRVTVKGAPTIAKVLEEKGILNPEAYKTLKVSTRFAKLQGTNHYKWKAVTVRKILTDMVYCSHMENGKYKVENYKTFFIF